MSVQSNHSALLQETHSDEAVPGSRLSSAHTMSTSKSLFSKTGMESQLVLPEKDEEKTKKNPFAVPPDFDIFSIRDKERQKAREERERMKTMKIHEKTTYSTKVKAKQKELRQALQEEEKEEARKQATNEESLKALQESLLRQIASKKDYPVEKETFRDYINVWKEILLLENDITVKREEIQRLEKIAKNEERKVKKAEQYLSKKTAIFEEFLKEKQKQSLQALKIAAKEAEKKTKKISEIQGVTSQIENLQNEISQLTIDLQEYKVYRNFLRHLSLKERQGERSKRYTSPRDVKTPPNTREGDASAPITAEQGQGGTAGTDTASPCSTNNMDVPSSLLSSKSLTVKSLREIKPQLINFLKPLSARKMSSLEAAETNTSSGEDEDPELYFTDPQQLLSLFMELEDENLSFIQKSQEAEESLHKVQQTFITTYESKEKELAELKEEVATLKSSIAKEEERAADLKLKAHLFSSGECKADDQDNILASLRKKVQEVYCQCTGESGENLQTVQMLMVLEKKLNDILERIPPEKIEHAKERRIKLREGKLRQQEQQTEKRLKKVLERSKVTVETKQKNLTLRHSETCPEESTGPRPLEQERGSVRPARLMFRSVLPPKKPKRKPRQEEIDKEEQLCHFT
ncbi:PREDICTED: coiled-coil domain-containing protein 37-like [Nestor notabilis]|uniref:coiled-coil domain-containing protein 37-like n=1 Tax=Nestor notabilis TaxID=176057 RepID=UPI000523B8B5|nr:PREDICTED: coiled-coil domain-containing protein 37-like [Nestor notabilis]